jgi:hypothetical protein
LVSDPASIWRSALATPFRHVWPPSGLRRQVLPPAEADLQPNFGSVGLQRPKVDPLARVQRDRRQQRLKQGGLARLDRPRLDAPKAS